jgi:hypothetical protein
MRTRTVSEAMIGYAVKFTIDSDEPPTDDNLRDVLRHCALPPRPAWFDGIRACVTLEREKIALLVDLGVTK